MNLTNRNCSIVVISEAKLNSEIKVMRFVLFVYLFVFFLLLFFKDILCLDKIRVSRKHGGGHKLLHPKLNRQSTLILRFPDVKQIGMERMWRPRDFFFNASSSLSAIKGPFLLPAYVGESNHTNLISPLAWGTFWIPEQNERSPCLLRRLTYKRRPFSLKILTSLLLPSISFLAPPLCLRLSLGHFFALTYLQKKQKTKKKCPGRRQISVTGWWFWSSSYTKPRLWQMYYYPSQDMLPVA